MQPEEWIILVLVVVCIVLFLLLCYSNRKLAAQSESIAQLDKQKRSQSVRYGKLTEQFMPFLESYPYDPHDFRFLGTPIDGVQFTDDSIVLIEFKTAGSQLSHRQRAIKKMVEEGAVRFESHRMS
ncbi:MAG: Holliday junction resolvase-like protein [Syntrophales bacterium]|nr:Holliday junction resolvase-like protein [Syntrophales bacterium]